MDYKRIKNQYFSNFPFTYSFPFLNHFLHLGPSATEYCSSIQSVNLSGCSPLSLLVDGRGSGSGGG